MIFSPFTDMCVPPPPESIREALYPLVIIPILSASPTPTPKPLVYFLSLWICLFWTFHINGILQHDWLLCFLFLSPFKKHWIIHVLTLLFAFSPSMVLISELLLPFWLFPHLGVSQACPLPFSFLLFYAVSLLFIASKLILCFLFPHNSSPPQLVVSWS